MRLVDPFTQIVFFTFERVAMCFLLCLERTEEGARGRHCERSPRPHENTVAAPAQPIPQRAAQKYVCGKSAVAQAETGYGH